MGARGFARKPLASAAASSASRSSGSPGELMVAPELGLMSPR
ncbi:hypothetical protein DB30_06878 [Enhygromyxa salina]|uniref:Uncharacterized protein n=1 Tax=Enhygromyxa salina TaxID=215803 RepID=A0A0C1ZTL8_9BACT|nr:hypothetical protein DB30_06878 [Enhygromyxa salina]